MSRDQDCILLKGVLPPSLSLSQHFWQYGLPAGVTAMPCVPWAPLLLGTVDEKCGFAFIRPFLLASFQVGFFSGVKWLCFPISRGRGGAGSMTCCPPL